MSRPRRAAGGGGHRARVYLRFLWVYPHLKESLHQLNQWLALIVVALSYCVAHGWLPGLRSELVKEIAEICELAALAVFVIFLIATVARYLALRFGNQDRAEPEVFLDLPDLPGQEAGGWRPWYVIRRVRPSAGNRKLPDPEDLDTFVRMAVATPGVADAHAHLSPEARGELYRRWWRWNPGSLLLLELHERDLHPDVVAVSIVLPLTRSGAAALVTARRSALDLQQDDVAAAGKRPKHLLLDTWIVTPEYKKVYSPYKAALVLKHLSLFWRMRDRGMHVFVEPDTPRMKRHLVTWGFTQAGRADGVDLFVVDFAAASLPREKAQALRQVADNIQIARTWPL